MAQLDDQAIYTRYVPRTEIAVLDSDTMPAVILVTGDEIDGTYCGECHAPAEDWPRLASYHPGSRPGVISQAELFCADCRPRGYNDKGLEVRTFCGTRHAFTDGNGINCGCFAEGGQA